jgi:hypothetical protein
MIQSDCLSNYEFTIAVFVIPVPSRHLFGKLSHWTLVQIPGVISSPTLFVAVTRLPLAETIGFINLIAKHSHECHHSARAFRYRCSH